MPGTSAEIERKLGLSMNNNGCLKAIVIGIFCSSIKTKEVEEEGFFARLVEYIERDIFWCLNLNVMLLSMVKYDVSFMN